MGDCSSLGCTVANGLLSRTREGVEAIYGALFASWPGLTITTLYIVIVGYLVIMGRAGERSKQWALSIFLLGILGGVAMNYATFTEWIGGPILDAAVRAGALAATGGESASGIQDILDASEITLGKVMSTIDEVEVPGSFITNAWLYLKIGVVVFIMGLLACAMYLATVALLSIAAFSLLMMFAVGGPCLWLASFKETRFITWAWVRAMANYALWIFFIGAVAGIGNKYVTIVVDALASWDVERDGVFNKVIGANMLLSSLCIYMLLKTTDWAAAITGGTASQTGIVGAMGGVAGGAIGSAINSGGRMAGGLAKWGGGVAANHTIAGGAAYRAYSAIRGLGQTK